MGSAQSAKCRRLFPLLPSSTRYHRLSDSSALLNQPLLQDENQLSVETKHEIQAYWEKSSALEKEIHGLKSNFDRLKTMVQTSISKLQSRPTSDAEVLSNQGSFIKRVEEKNIDVEKEIAELKTGVNEMRSTMVDLAAVTAELMLESLRPKEAPKSAKVRITITALMDGLCIILIFLIGVLIGLNI